MYVIRFVEYAGMGQHPEGRQLAGKLLRDFDVDAAEGRGHGTFTDDPNEAMTFASPVAAQEFWRRPSTVVPLRPDGKPNRPFTSITIEIVPLVVVIQAAGSA